MRKPVFGTETPLALNRILTPTDLVYDVLVPSYACFRKKKEDPNDAPKSLPPPHYEGTAYQ